uniref:Uncharacterized protein n=1 Tax=Oryza sativa subsp. japonica TaxID=39947 RepID=Q6K4U0_ORYSJ|nr:hypothetical protein [Oryza sativa Japonica Group]BAD23347.1 hypothetical protein [Oryza sativa Japonica Group]
MEDHVSPVSEAKAREMRGVKGDDGVGVGDDGVSSATELYCILSGGEQRAATAPSLRGDDAEPQGPRRAASCGGRRPQRAEAAGMVLHGAARRPAAAARRGGGRRRRAEAGGHGGRRRRAAAPRGGRRPRRAEAARGAARGGGRHRNRAETGGRVERRRRVAPPRGGGERRRLAGHAVAIEGRRSPCSSSVRAPPVPLPGCPCGDGAMEEFGCVGPTIGQPNRVAKFG